MLAFVAGLAVALFSYYTTGLTWLLIGLFWLSALTLQVGYVRRLNAFMGGNDPVATFGTRNLNQLRRTISVPLSITTLSFVAKVLAWAGVGAVLFSFGWLKIETF